MLQFTRLGPAEEPTVEVPPLAIRLSDYSLVDDPSRGALVCVTAPDHHRVGHSWLLDDRGFHEATTRTHRVGSQHGPWTSVYDPTRQAIVAWGFDYKDVCGVVLGDQPEVLTCTGELPTLADDGTWDNLVGVFGVDPRRGVTVCVTQGGIHELTGTRWARVSGPPAGVPTDVDGDRGRRSSGAGAVWDAPRGELLFWFHDRDARRLCCFAWDGATWRAVTTDGLPEANLCPAFGGGIALGDHVEHGVVLYVGPEHGLFARTATAWRALDTGIDPPPRGRGAQLAYDHARGVLVLGPYETNAGKQNVFHELKDGRWRRLGRIRTKSTLDDLGRLFFARHRGVVHASGTSLRTVAWNPATYWTEVVDDDSASAVCGDAHADSVVTAWDGRLHGAMNDGSVTVLGDEGWTRRADGSSWKQPEHPVVAFDPIRSLIVAWGPRNKGGAHKDETYTFDGTTWTRVTSAKAKPLDKDKDHDLFVLFFDTARGMVARLGQHEITHFDGTTWHSTRLVGGDAIETWRRAICHDPATGLTAIVNLGKKTVVRLDGATVTPVDRFIAPARRERDENLPFDHWWFDETTLTLNVHNTVDQTESFALDLRPAFVR